MSNLLLYYLFSEKPIYIILKRRASTDNMRRKFHKKGETIFLVLHLKVYQIK